MVQVTKCQNGVRIVSEHIPYTRSISIGIWVDAGSRYELPEENGITHFIEHMLFKGTTTRTAQQIAEEFDRIGGEVNAFTSKEHTCYFAKVLDHHAPIALDVLADMFFNSTFTKEELEREKQVVLEELYMSEDAPDDDVGEMLWQLVYPNDALGRSILGSEETIKSFDESKIRNYMAKLYGPKNVVISVAGNISEDLLGQIETLFGKFQPSPKFEKPKLTYPRFTPGEKTKTRDIEQAHVAICYPAISNSDPRKYALVALNNILGGNMSSRLFQEVREKRGLAYSIYSFHTCLADVGTLTIYGCASRSNLSAMQHTIDQVLLDLVAGGVTDKELEDAKNQLKGSFVLSLEGSEAHMSRNGMNELMHGNHHSVDEVLEKIDAITMDIVNDLISEIFLKEPAIAIIGPEQ